jgi:putative Holliday junction resolvase
MMSEHGWAHGHPMALPSGSRIMGLDYGTVRVGVALSDPGLVIASPWGTLDAVRGLLPGLRALIAAEQVGLVVLGLPDRPDGTPGTLDPAVRHLAGVLERGGVPVVFQDEAFSSVRARQSLVLGGGSRRDRGGQYQATDRVAAALLLQDWLDAHAELRSGGS